MEDLGLLGMARAQEMGQSGGSLMEDFLIKVLKTNKKKSWCRLVFLGSLCRIFCLKRGWNSVGAGLGWAKLVDGVWHWQ